MINGFHDTIRVKRVLGCGPNGSDFDSDGRPIWELLDDLYFYSAKWGCWFMVPAGFRTNFASVPRLPFVYWWYGDRCWEEPALHDFGYTVHGVYIVDCVEIEGRLVFMREHARLVPMTRKQTDDLFREALLLNPASPDGMDHTMHAGVRLGGGSSWKDETNIDQRAEIKALILPA